MRWLLILGPDNEHGTWRVVQHVMADRAEQYALHEASPVGTDDQRVIAVVLGDSAQLRARIADHHLPLVCPADLGDDRIQVTLGLDDRSFGGLPKGTVIDHDRGCDGATRHSDRRDGRLNDLKDSDLGKDRPE